MAELTLDPHDWNDLTKLGHRMVDDMMSYLSGLSERPAWQQVPSESVAAIRQPLPTRPQGFETTYQSFKEHVLPYPNGNIHPRFWGWVQGTGTPYAMLADMLASGLNPHMAGFNQAPAVVEETVMAWLKEMMGFSEESSGLLTSGGTMANLTGLAVARHDKADFDFRRKGFQGHAGKKLTVYTSSETHKWAKDSMELLGFGSDFLRIVEVTEAYQINLEQLTAMIDEDIKNNLQPFCIIGNCGTVNTGAIDDLESLATIAEKNGMWFHVDGAFGALAYLSAKYRHLVRGLERADSVAFDLHKWMYLPFEVGCILVHKPGAQAGAFSSDASYLRPSGRGVCAGPLAFADLGIELSRGFKALKVWMSLKAHGTEIFGQLIEQNIDQCQRLAGLIKETRDLELLAPVNMNVVCFRFRDSGLDDCQLDSLNNELLHRLQESGAAVPSGTRVKGRFALRVANVNHRSKERDFELLLAEVTRIGREVAAELGDRHD